jgi:thiamine biosynthesis lipoprotein ApbE
MPRFALPFALVGALVGLGLADAPAAPQEFTFHRDHVLGTSLDLTFVAPDEATAEAAELTALDEIERLRMVFSTYDANSELSALNRTREPMAVSADLAAVIEKYGVWHKATNGALSPQVGELVSVWKEGEKANRVPDAVVLNRIVADLAKPGWKLDANTNTVQRLTDQPLNLNAIAKGYIVRKAALAVRKAHPKIGAMLVNLGGDILALGDRSWAVGVQDPVDTFDNSPPVAGLKLSNKAVATSGAYQRYYTIGGKRYSHIFDPRTGKPAEGVQSATVVANDNETANALATALCVLPIADGLKLIERTSGAGCYVIDAAGTAHRVGVTVFDVFNARAAQDKKDAPKVEAWPAGFRVTVAVQLPQIDAKQRYRKPYTAVWVEDDKGKAVRTLAVWGNSPKYLKDLNDWWKIGKGNTDLIKAVTRATRGPGKYDLVWDGKDDKGTALGQGTYTVRVEVHREFGQHLLQNGKIECKDKAATEKLAKNAETGETVIEYKAAKK